MEEPDLGDLLTSYYHSEILVEEPHVGDLLTRVRLGSIIYTIASVDYNPHITIFHTISGDIPLIQLFF